MRPRPPELQALADTLFTQPGHLEPAVRRAAAAGGAVPPEVAGFVAKVSHHAFKVTDEDVAALIAGGWTEDQVFELVLATALGAGLARLDAAFALLEGA